MKNISLKIHHKMKEFKEKYNAVLQINLKNCKNIADVIVAKQRHGPIGSLQLHFNAKFTKFSNLTDEKYQPKDTS